MSAINGTTNTTSAHSLLEGKTVPSVLDNQAWEGLNGSYDLNDPHSGELLYKVASVTPDDCLKAVESAHEAFKSWKTYSPVGKRAIFNKAADLLMERKDEFVKLAMEETTANAFWGAVDHQLAWNIVSETAALATLLNGKIIPSENGQRAYVERIPFGVVLGIAPWNAPLTLGIRAFANAIMAGNTVVFKTSEYSPKIHTFATQLFLDAGLPKGVLNTIHIAPKDAPKVVEAIIAHKHVRKVNFTGSTFVGAKIAEVCGRYIKPVVLELGGKAPVIVLKDANLRAAANAAVFGGLSHQGQICMASDALIVHEDVADEFTSILSSMLKNKSASAFPEGTFGMRGLFSQVHADKVTSLVKDATSKGAKVLIGDSLQSEKNVIQPIVLGETNKEMKIYSEEIFGPAMTLNRFQSVEEAIEMANSSDYGLAASVYGTDAGECWRVASQIESGQVHINGATVHDQQNIPHGGLKKSGYGKFNGMDGMYEFTTARTITINHAHDQYPM